MPSRPPLGQFMLPGMGFSSAWEKEPSKGGGHKKNVQE